MKIASAAIAAFLLIAGAGTGLAQKLPKSAKPMDEAAVKALYAGRTADWKTSRAFFATDGQVRGLFGKKLNEAYYEGTWTAAGNEVCMKVKGTNIKTRESDGKIYTDCWQWFLDGKGKHWTLWSVRFDGSKVPKNDYYTDEIKKLKDGDLVTEAFIKAKGP